MSDVVPLKTRRSGTRLRIGFLRLTDSAPAIVAQEFGYFADEGVDAELLEEPSWANIADKLAYGFLDAAVIVPPLAFAIEMGLRGVSQKLVIPCNLSLGGNTITLSRDLAGEVRNTASKGGLSIVAALAQCLKTRTEPLPLGIVHAYSTHNLLLRYWLATAGLEAGRDVRLSVVPPARAVEALQSGQIAGFCAGAPWGEIAARAGAGTTVATSDHIWRNAPEKAFAVRARWAEENPDALKGAIRALVRAAQFCDAPENASYTGALLSRQKYLNVDSHAILSSLPGGAITQDNLSRFWRQAATFPWRSHALWFLRQMVRWDLIGDIDAGALAARVYRPDLYRAAVAPLGISVPLTDSKLEGAHDAPWQLGASPNSLPMGPDSFCDGAVFEASPEPAAF
ncbi:MAG TPA: CmpA/NrtA family ABC transporter substrate-binding protein [Rhizomicrobium sp.]|jgi:NitT/TauT family transport system ATP-binding protein/nitrate/nitrite transport system substrate-binding protein|nr:CmpA/NrtA family ABC transporter substrate-binding protein [Rhizomicrobium sp.]